MSTRKIFGNTLMTLISQIVSMISSFIIPRLIIGTYGSSINGVMNSINQFLALTIILEFGVSTVIQSILYKPIIDNDYESIGQIFGYTRKIYKRISIGLFFYVVILGIALPHIVDFSGISRFDLFVLTAILGGIQLVQNYLVIPYIIFLTASHKAYVYLIIQSLVVILQTISIAVAITLPVTILELKLITLCILLIKPIFVYSYVRRKYKNLNLKSEKNISIPDVWYGGTQHITAVILENTDVIILSLFSTLANVSIYSIYFLVVQGIRKMITIFSNGIIPYFGMLYASKKIEKLKESFINFEVMMNLLMIIAYTSTIVLIIPFIRNYLGGSTDINYEMPMFGFLMSLAQAAYILRYTYYTLITATGQFRETRLSAVIEASINIVVSVIAVLKFGLVGVAFGTFIAMVYRSIHLSYYCSKKILNRSNSMFIKLLITDLTAFLTILLVMDTLDMNMNGFTNWIISAIYIVIINTIITLSLFGLFYPKLSSKYVKKLYSFIRRKEAVN